MLSTARCLSLALAALAPLQAGDQALSAVHARAVWAERALLFLDELAAAAPATAT